MRVKVKKVYYCEFCGKHRLMPNVIKEHEKHCTVNPNRVCGLCGNTKPVRKIHVVLSEDSGESVDEYKKRVEAVLSDIDCPVCKFARLQQGGVISSLNYFFSLREELQKWWDEKYAIEDLAIEENFRE